MPLFACFVDGELVILHRKSFPVVLYPEVVFVLFTYLFIHFIFLFCYILYFFDLKSLNASKWNADYNKELKKYSFYIDDVQIGVQPDG